MGEVLIKEYEFSATADCDIYCGNWGDVKKDILVYAAERITCYHGDIFITFGQVADRLSDKNLLSQNLNIRVYIHGNGADYVDIDYPCYDAHNRDMLKRAVEHKGVVMSI